jgi:hypothetical protein
MLAADQVLEPSEMLKLSLVVMFILSLATLSFASLK